MDSCLSRALCKSRSGMQVQITQRDVKMRVGAMIHDVKLLWSGMQVQITQRDVKMRVGAMMSNCCGLFGPLPQQRQHVRKKQRAREGEREREREHKCKPPQRHPSYHEVRTKIYIYIYMCVCFVVFALSLARIPPGAPWKKSTWLRRGKNPHRLRRLDALKCQTYQPGTSSPHPSRRTKDCLAV
jgi:hypothetical protein